MENIALIRRELGLTQTELAEKLGVHRRTIQEWEKGGVIPETKKMFIKNMLNEMHNNVQEEKEEDTRPVIPSHLAAGSLTGFADAVKSYDCEMHPVIRNFPSYDYTMVVKGDSMEPKFEGGDEIAIKKVESFIEWGKPYVLDTRDGAVLKRLYDDGDSLRCVSYNDEYPDFSVLKSDIFDIYKVVGLIRV